MNAEENNILPGTKMDSNAIFEVPASTSNSLKQMAEASTPQKLVRVFKGTETYMGKYNILMERDEFWVIPATATTLPNPEDHAIGTQFGQGRVKGNIFKGQNRKERRAKKSNKYAENRVPDKL